MTAALQRAAARAAAPVEDLGALACRCLVDEVETYPKPGLVSHVDSGAHRDMDAALLRRSAATLEPYFRELAAAGAAGAGMDRLRVVGVAAERAMLAVTGGVNTHRGAIFGLGLLCAAAGLRQVYDVRQPLGALIRQRWGADILAGPAQLRSHGAEAARRFGAGGARGEAAHGLPSVYEIAVPALRTARGLTPGDEEAARVQACMALIAGVADTNLLHRGGLEGLSFAQTTAQAFLAEGGVGRKDWRFRAGAAHRAFVARNLSPGGSADLLAMALFADRLEA